MPKIQCPEGHILTVKEEHAGRVVRCPQCQTTMQVPQFAAPMPVAEVVDDDRAAAPKPMRLRERDDDNEAEYEADQDKRGPRVTKKERRQALGRVGTGLGLHIARISIIILGSLAIGFYAGFATLQDAQRAGQRQAPGEVPQSLVETTKTVLLFSLVLNVGAALLGIAGSALCTGVPRDFRGKGLIFGSLTADVVVLLINILSYAAADPAAQLRRQVRQEWDPTNLAFTVVSVLFWIASTVMFLLFLSNLASYVKRESLQDQTQSVTTFGIVAIALYIGGVAAGIVVPLLGLLTIIGAICLLVWIIRYIRLLSAFREALP